MDINELTAIVLDTCIKIHKTIGPGCYEKVYEEILYYEQVNKEMWVDRQVMMPLSYERMTIDDAYKIDILINQHLVLEIKSVERVAPVHFKQLMTYLKLSNIKNGLLLNFNVEWMKDGFHRVFNNSGV